MMQRNPFICLAIVVSLATIAIVSTLGIVVIAINDRQVPSSLVSLSSAALGAIAGALAMAPHSLSQYRPPEQKS